ncbi:MAG TPA: sigma-54-dependent Fis family transcriptional regulator [Syntrophaceae bacterium]|nr:sigma-54-dependent Fis family transcriptional regulator [Syntrophaceae bacterium]
MPLGKILVVDDDRNILEVMGMRLEAEGYQVATALDEKQATKIVQGEVLDLAIVDLKLASQNGITLMEKLHLINPDTPIIILTAYGTIESAVNAMQRGAYSYLTKPFDYRELLMHISNALEKKRLSGEIKRLKAVIGEKYSFENIVAHSEKMQRVLEQVSRVAETDSTIYIHGESGTGKELIARALHLTSKRSGKPFVAVNCAALPESLLESELFGHVKGAFTGAYTDRDGLFARAHGGSIFLDEIGATSSALQAMLLRVLEEREFYPVGMDRSIKVDVRVIVSTNKDLEEEVKRGNFREDLFYRIHVIPIHLPPLRERKEDIPPLANFFLKKFSQQMKKEVKGILPSALQKLMLYHWPGNVRELENTIEYAVVMTTQDVISEEFIIFTDSRHVRDQFKPFKEAKKDFEKQYLTQLLNYAKGNITKASKLAGKYRADLYNLIKKYHLRPEDFKDKK